MTTTEATAPRLLAAGLDDKSRWIVELFTRGVYSVSEDGRVFRHFKTKDPSEVKSHKHSKTGYRQLTLSHGGVQKCVLLHRLVALYYIPNPEFLPAVNHKDGDKNNNSRFNLEWVTAGENNRHSYEIGKRSAVGEYNGQAKLSESQVIEIRRLCSTGLSRAEIGKRFSVHMSTIGEMARREIWSHI